jgi:hypothetical protein
MKIYYISTTDDTIDNINNVHNPFFKTLLLYNKYVSIANDIADADFIMIDSHISNVDKIHQFNKFKNKYLRFKRKIIICIYAPIDEKISRTQHYDTDDRYNDLFDDNFIYFTILNIKLRPNIIFIPLGSIPPEMINQNYLSDMKIDKNNNQKISSKLYFRGSPTHKIRNIVCEYLKDKNKCNIILNKSINYFWDKTQNNSNNYQEHLQDCYDNGMSLLIRGDREFCYVFCDYLYCENVICFINANSYKTIGLEKFGLDDVFLFFDIDEKPLDDVYKQIINILNDDNKMFENRKKVKEFYESFIMIDRAFKSQYAYHGGYNGFTHFIVYKMYKLLHNNYVLDDNKILDKDVLSIFND